MKLHTSVKFKNKLLTVNIQICLVPMPHLIPLKHRHILSENERLGSSLSPVTKSLSSMSLDMLVIIDAYQITIKLNGLKQLIYLAEILQVRNLGRACAGQFLLKVFSVIEFRRRLGLESSNGSAELDVHNASLRKVMLVVSWELCWACHLEYLHMAFPAGSVRAIKFLHDS